MKKRTRTLNQTWTLCLRMWWWVAKVWQTPRYRRYDIVDLKRIWLRKNGFRYSYLRGDCFFCENKNICNIDSCDKGCPGVLVNRVFDCCDYDYHYENKPVKFYKELLRLNRIRKAKK